ncbi:hypothetical protein LIER_30253 [Lithospermum erythrorhizon]|uniref:Uncharacterized protein n=1 Tax=Lithospermum erythrorhizon TaxID=34254 RepID=A0AAV3RNV1_LITER
MRILGDYEEASGQKVNLNKCSVNFDPATLTGNRRTVLDILGMRKMADHGKNLGLPLYIGKSGKYLGFYKRRWKLGSMDGRGGIGIQWKSWNKLCEEESEGELRFKDLECMNLAFLAKQGWLIYKHLCSTRFLRGGTFDILLFLMLRWDLDHRLVGVVFLMEEGYFAKEVDGELGMGGVLTCGRNIGCLEKPIFSCEVKGEKPRWVSQLIRGGEWDSELVERVLERDDAIRVLAIPLGRRGINNRLIWRHTRLVTT